MGEPCVNLQSRFGRRYRVGIEANGVTALQWLLGERIWLEQILCRYGLVHPHGGDLLVAVTDRANVARRLRQLACVLRTRGDVQRQDGRSVGELRATFHVDDAAAVFAVMRPYRRRQLSPEQRAQNAEILARARQRIGSTTLSGSEPEGPRTHATVAAGLGPIADAPARVSISRSAR